MITEEPFTSVFPEMNDPSVQGIVIAAFELGALVGALSCLDLGDRLGRRSTVWVGMCFMLVGGCLQCSAWNVGQLLTGRVVSGIGLGLQVRFDFCFVSDGKVTIHGRLPRSLHGSRKPRSLIPAENGVSSSLRSSYEHVINIDHSHDRRRSTDFRCGVRSACILGLLLHPRSSPVASSRRHSASSSVNRVPIHQFPAGISAVARQARHGRRGTPSPDLAVQEANPS